MEQIFKPPFLHFIKKQHKPLILAIRDEVGKVAANPTSGEMKTGDLAGIQVHKFTFNRQSICWLITMKKTRSLFT